MDDTFAERLERVMREAGVSKSELARRLYGTRKTARGHDAPRNYAQINRLLDPKVRHQFSTVRKVADALGVPISVLMPELKEGVGSGFYVEEIDELTSRLEVRITAPKEVVKAAILILAPYAS